MSRTRYAATRTRCYGSWRRSSFEPCEPSRGSSPAAISRSGLVPAKSARAKRFRAGFAGRRPALRRFLGRHAFLSLDLARRAVGGNVLVVPNERGFHLL